MTDVKSLGLAAVAVISLFFIDRVTSSVQGTPRAVREIFIGRCEDYKTGAINKLADENELSTKNCTELWNLFSSAWVGRDACSPVASDYKEFVDAAAITVPKDTANFWDGWDIYDTVRAYSREGQRSWTLDYTFIGYLVNGYYFCGSEDGDGIDYNACPNDGGCGFGKGAADAFWAQASIYFSTNATGRGRVFFNSSRPGGAFQDEESFFAQYELENLTPEKISRMDIYVLSDVKQTPVENCESESIQKLKTTLTDKNIEYMCLDNPSEVFHQLCIDYDEHEDCTFLSDGSAIAKPAILFSTMVAMLTTWLMTQDS